MTEPPLDESYHPAPDTDGELLPVVDMDDRQTGLAPRAEIHANNWIHRAVHVVLHDGAGRVLACRRSARKDRFPGWWDVSVGGHVGPGEAYAEAARREMAEEMGLGGPEPLLIAVLPPDPENGWEHLHVFSARIRPGDERPDPAEIDAAEWLDGEDFEAAFAGPQPPRRMTIPALRSFERHFRGGNY